jgi:hypothetical protein
MEGALVDALKALMSRSLDYAGLFPPAQLPLKSAIEEFAQIRADENEWLVVRFVLPALRISEFSQEARGALAEASLRRTPWHISGLIRSAAPISEALDLLRSEASLLRGLCDSHAGALVLDSLELPLPDEVANSHDQDLARGFFQEAIKILDELQLRVPMFWEVRCEKSFEHVALAAFHLNRTEDSRICLKFRTGGLTPQAIVSPESLAHAFRLTISHQVPFKLTAGLHLALRHYDGQVGTELFGFLNTFCAAVLGWKHMLSETELALLLQEKSLANFKFTNDSLSWKHYTASISEIQSIRTNGLKSFGSCSFYEPIEDLKKLSLIQ